MNPHFGGMTGKKAGTITGRICIMDLIYLWMVPKPSPKVAQC